MGKHKSSIDGAIIDRIKSKGPGKVFTPSDFLDLGSRAAIDQALSRNGRSGILRKVARGLYDLPQHHRIWGEIPSPPVAIVDALARRDGITAKSDGPVYLTDGRSRRVLLGRREIVFRHVSARTLARIGTPVDEILRALRRLGRGKIDDREIADLGGQLTGTQRAALLRDIRLAPAWAADVIRRLAGPAMAEPADSAG